MDAPSGWSSPGSIGRELADQLAGILGEDPNPELVDAIYARSDGNAFYAEELLAAEPRPIGYRRRCDRSSSNALRR